MTGIKKEIYIERNSTGGGFAARSLPWPFSVAAAAARSRGGFGGADAGWRVADRKPSHESLPGCHDEMLFAGIFASTKRVPLARSER